jgi:hypothetical protein
MLSVVFMGLFVILIFLIRMHYMGFDLMIFGLERDPVLGRFITNPIFLSVINMMFGYFGFGSSYQKALGLIFLFICLLILLLIGSRFFRILYVLLTILIGYLFYILCNILKVVAVQGTKAGIVSNKWAWIFFTNYKSLPYGDMVDCLVWMKKDMWMMLASNINPEKYDISTINIWKIMKDLMEKGSLSYELVLESIDNYFNSHIILVAKLPFNTDMYILGGIMLITSIILHKYLVDYFDLTQADIWFIEAMKTKMIKDFYYLDPPPRIQNPEYNGNRLWEGDPNYDYMLFLREYISESGLEFYGIPLDAIAVFLYKYPQDIEELHKEITKLWELLKNQ